MMFKIKYNFVILELIRQPYFDLKKNNSKKKMYEIKCLINCFRIASLSSNFRDKTHICQCNIAFMWSFT